MAQAQDRFALVIGNGAYETIPPVAAAGANAELVAQSLEAADFEVELVRDANLVALKRSIGAFSQRVRSAGPDAMGLLYFAGHGVNAFSDNFLLPVDVEVSSPDDLDFVAVNVTTLLYAFDPKIRARNIVILDCCAANPYPLIDGVGESLVGMTAPEGNFLAFAALPGVVQPDGDGPSVFASAVAEAMTVPGLSIDDVLSRPAAAGQIPFVSTGLVEPFMFVEAVAPAAEDVADVAPVEDVADTVADEDAAWAALADAETSAEVLAFLESFPDGTHQEAAKQRLLDLLAAELGTPVPADADTDVVAQEAPEAPVAEDAPVEDQSTASDAVAEDAAPLAEQTEEAAVASAPEEPAPADTLADIPLPVFDQPLAYGSDKILGKTFAEIIESSPIHPPIEGLPEELWKDQKCANCHQWTKDDLCTQANFYLTTAGEQALTKKHPFGGTLKQNLRRWAEGGCP